MLTDGEVTFLIDEGGIDAINDAAHALGALTVSVMRTEALARGAGGDRPARTRPRSR